MMSTRTTFAGAALSLAAAASLNAAPLVALSDDVNLFFIGQATARYESNFLLVDEDNNALVAGANPYSEEGDMIFIFSPGFSLEAGEEDNTTAFATLTVRENFKMYLDNSQYDSELFDSILRAGYDTQRVKLTADIRYYEDDQPTAGTIIPTQPTAAPIERDIIDGRTYGEYTLSPKTSFGAGLQYFSREFENNTYYTDTSYWAIPADFYYAVSPKIDVSVGGRYRSNEVESANNDSEDYFFNIGVRGDLTPKLVGSARIGYQIRDYDSAGDEGQLALNADLTYNIGPRSRMTLLASRDFGSAAVTGTSIEDTNVRFSYYYAITPMWTAFSMLSYQFSEYEGAGGGTAREDHTYNLGVGASYAPNNYISFEARYNYALNASTAPVDYANHIISFSASLRY